jgi:hypothetical protein
VEGIVDVSAEEVMVVGGPNETTAKRIASSNIIDSSLSWFFGLIQPIYRIDRKNLKFFHFV